MNTSNTIDYLLTHNVKPSVQRIAIMEYLLEHHTHPTAEEIHTALSSSIPTLSKTTVYNTLRLFVDNNAATMLTIDERKVCFDGDLTPHGHLLCKCCGRVYDVTTAEQTALNQPVYLEGHEVTEVHTYYKGICKVCKQTGC